MNALVASDYFDYSKTYFYIEGIAGINPACGTLGSVAFARYAVQVGLEFEIDAREIPANFGTSYVPLGAKTPDSYPVFLYGSEVYELNVNFRDRAIALASQGTLNDTAIAIAYRKLYPDAPAKQPPAVFAGDVATLLTNGSGKHCMTAREDNASMEAFLRGALYGLVDSGRIILMRTAANFDRPPPGESAAMQLFDDNQGGFGISVANIYQAGINVVNDIIDYWDEVYYDDITNDNYIGDILDSLKGSITPDIGSVFFQKG